MNFPDGVRPSGFVAVMTAVFEDRVARGDTTLAERCAVRCTLRQMTAAALADEARRRGDAPVLYPVRTERSYR